MTTAGQRLVALSGLGSATAAQHFMALSSGGGGAVASVQGVQVLFGRGPIHAYVAGTLPSNTIPVTCGEVGVAGGTPTPALPYYVGEYDLIGTARGVLCVSWAGDGAVVIAEGEAASAFSLSGPEPAIICLNDAPGATVLTGNDAAFHLS